MRFPGSSKTAVVEWGKWQHPTYAALGLMAIDAINADFPTVETNKPIQQ